MLLGPADPLPCTPSRVLVNGSSGSGKSTMASRLATLWRLPYTELDGLFHGPGWEPRPTFEDDVARLAASDRWVSEWQYGAARPVLLARADLLVWVDPPHLVAAHQVARRTLSRRLHRTELWNGNVEPPLRTFLADRDHVVRYAWRNRRAAAARARDVLRDRPDLPVVRLRGRRAAHAWLAGPASAVGRD